MQYIPDNPHYHVRVDSAIGAFPQSDILRKVVSERISFLYDNMAESNRLLLKRTELLNICQLEISNDHVRIQNLLFEIENSANKNAISSLEGRLVELSKEKRNQQLSHWRDTVELRRELRKTEKELRAAIMDMWLIQFLNP